VFADTYDCGFCIATISPSPWQNNIIHLAAAATANANTNRVRGRTILAPLQQGITLWATKLFGQRGQRIDGFGHMATNTHHVCRWLVVLLSNISAYNRHRNSEVKIDNLEITHIYSALHRNSKSAHDTYTKQQWLLQKNRSHRVRSRFAKTFV